MERYYVNRVMTKEEAENGLCRTVNALADLVIAMAKDRGERVEVLDKETIAITDEEGFTTFIERCNK